MHPCQIACLVMSNVSPVTCHLSSVTCCMSIYIYFFFMETNLYTFKSFKKKLDKVVELVGGGSVINGAYPV